MDPGVVIATKDQIVDDGLAALRPGNTVMNVAPFGRAPTIAGDAMPIPRHDGTT